MISFSWHIILKMRASTDSCEPLGPLDLPHSLHAFHRVSNTNSMDKVCTLLIYLDPPH